MSRGTIGVCAQETSRYSDFAVSLANLRRPAGWEVLGAYGCDVALSRHRLAEAFDGDYLFVLDDDHVFEPGLLERLLAHGEDIVGAFCLTKYAPFRPVLSRYDMLEGADLLEGAPGLHEVAATGTAALLVHRRVFDALDAPYFWPPDEDRGFCQRARAAGFRVFVDTAAWLAHLAPAAVWPAWDGREWRAQVRMHDRFTVEAPLEHRYADGGGRGQP
jgi:GT2 family glycosyltransferase